MYEAGVFLYLNVFADPANVKTIIDMISNEVLEIFSYLPHPRILIEVNNIAQAHGIPIMVS